MNTLPRLANGLDLNVHFTGITDFEFTEEISVLDALDIPLLPERLIDLNVHFPGVTDLKFTEEISVFDALDIPLLHG